jgi:hypothetical protein
MQNLPKKTHDLGLNIFEISENAPRCAIDKIARPETMTDD